MKKIFLIGSCAMMLFSSTPVLAATEGDTLSKLKELQQQDQNSSTNILLPNLKGQTIVNALPTAADIKADLGENPKDRLNDLKTAAMNSSDPADFFKLGIAYELTGDNNNAITSIHKAVALAPNEKELYKELVTLYQAQNPGIISVIVNGDKLDFKDGNEEVNPVIINGNTLVPIRKITEKLGAKVEWNNDTHTATIRLLDSTIELVQDSTNARANGTPVTLEVPAQNIGGHILVPLRFISEQFNKNVDYVPGEKGTAIIPITDKN